VGYLLEYGASLAATLALSIVAALRGGFDVIHAHNPPDLFVLVALLYRPFGKRFVFDHHDLSPEMYDARFGDRARPLLRRALIALERLTFRVADQVISTNESYRSIAVERGGVEPERTTVVRNGPDLARVRPTDPDPALRARAGTIVGYVGEMNRQDGVDYLIRAIGELRDRLGISDVLAVIVGTGSDVPALEALTEELGLGDSVWFTGRVPDDDLMRYLSTADICVVPDPRNPFTDRSTMIKMMEYMALAKPVVAFDLTEHRRTAGDAALYATPNSELELARCLATLIQDPDARARLGEMGRQAVNDRLSWPHQEQALLDVYRRLGSV
jgi:glycosyltransferase involved in cell wall biosynthesis